MTSPYPDTRLTRELERERDQRVKHDDEKIGGGRGDDLRNKDARDNNSSGELHRSRPR